MSFSSYSSDRQALDAGETSCTQLVSSFLERIDARNDRLNAFISIDREGALARAAELDAQPARGPLHGMVVAIKDVIVEKGKVATCGSRMLESFRSLYSATAVERMVDAGAIIIGRTNCDEFGMGSSNENSYFGPVRNPIDESRVPGGSSGGSAAAVAAGMCHVALGTDTGGSVRQPASFCGIMGLKPTYGRVSRYGLVAYASSFDVIGPMGRDVDDLARVMEVIAGVDPRDGTSAPVPVPAFRPDPAGDLTGLRVGIPREFLAEGVSEDVERVLNERVDRLRDAGATVEEISLPHTHYGVAAFYVLTTAEASSNLARFDGVRFGYRADEASRKGVGGTAIDAMYAASRSEAFGDEVKRRLMLGTYVLSSGYYDAYYARAQRVRTLIRRDFEAAFGDVDLILTPATPSTAFRLGEKSNDPLSMYLNDTFTVTASLAGVPGLVLPAGSDAEGMPVGLQLLAPHFREDLLLRAGDGIMKISEPA